MEWKLRDGITLIYIITNQSFARSWLLLVVFNVTVKYIQMPSRGQVVSLSNFGQRLKGGTLLWSYSSPQIHKLVFDSPVGSLTTPY